MRQAGLGVFNIGGRSQNTLSLLGLLDTLEELTDKTVNLNLTDWRPADQKVCVSDTSKAKTLLSWSPKVNPKNGVKKLVEWVSMRSALSTQRGLAT